MRKIWQALIRKAKSPARPEHSKPRYGLEVLHDPSHDTEFVIEYDSRRISTFHSCLLSVLVLSSFMASPDPPLILGTMKRLSFTGRRLSALRLALLAF